MGCCGDDAVKELDIMAREEERLPAVYNHPSMAKHILVGHATKTKYGFLANGRLIPGGVYPADVRTRPELYVCANCGNRFVVADDKVYCGSCSIGQVQALETGRPTKSIRDIKPLPPPPDITQPEIPEPVMMTAPTDLNDIEFSGKRHDAIAKLLRENGIETDLQANALYVDGLVKIKGIGEKTAKDIIAAIEAA